MDERQLYILQELYKKINPDYEKELERQKVIERTIEAAQGISKGSGIKDDVDVALWDYDIKRLLNNKIKILTYNQLKQYNDIYDIFYPYGYFILLYMSKQNYGHWCCVLLHKDRIEFFDPYGGNNEPDEQLEHINKQFKKQSNQDYPYLTKLLYESGVPIEYNDHKFQRLASNIKTCGRHCVVRIKHRDKLIDDYYEFIIKQCKLRNMTPDEYVTYVTTK